jgi:hypothetical protein
MIVGGNPRDAVIDDTVLLRGGHGRGIGTIVDADATRYKVYWRNRRGHLAWYVRRELTLPRLDYGRQWP